MFSDIEKWVMEFGFRPNDKVVDLGSGAGHYTQALSRAVGNEGKVVAVDIDKDRLSRLKTQALKVGRENIEVIWGDIEVSHGTHLKDSYFDGAVLSTILYRLKHPEEAAKEAFRVVKPGARVGVVDWTNLAFLGENKTHVSIPLEKAQKFFTDAGFSLEKNFGAGEHHYGLIFKKNLK